MALLSERNAMDRRITGFHLDDEGHWVAELQCGHGQHVRHTPPWQIRAWVTTEAGRQEHLGTTLGCVRCDRRELPETARLRRRTPTFDESSTPQALRSRHTTKPGVWAVVHIVEVSLAWQIFDPLAARGQASAGETLVMPPEVEHQVEPGEQARFFIELMDGRPPAR
jgi:tellurite methyltransferase